MLRSLLGALLLALPLAASGQITHVVSDGVWFIDGTDGADTLFIGCNEGAAQVNDTDPVSGAIDCSLITRFEVRMGPGADFGLITDTPDFGLDPAIPSTLDGGPDPDFFQFDLAALTADLTVHVAPTPTLGGLGAIHIQRDGVDFFQTTLLDLDLGVDLVLGSGDDRIVVDAVPPDPGLGLQVFAGPGADLLDGTAAGVHLPLTFLGEGGDDVLLSGPQPTSLGWNPGDGTDRFVGGDGHNQVRVFGGEPHLGLHAITEFLWSGCSLFDFNDGGGVIDEGIDEAVVFPGAGGTDLFLEIECSFAESVWSGNTGPDRTLFRGRAGGGNGLDLDFEFDNAIFTDGFESGDVSSWSTGTDLHGGGQSGPGGTLWDGIDYQDWPSFEDPATSGPSTVTIRGRPDFPVTIDMGPDGGTGFGGAGGAVDTLRVDPLGLSVDDDGSRIVIGGGPPITYAGVDALVIVGSTDTPGGPGAAAPSLSVFPNPTAGTARIRLTGARAEALRLAVVDGLGREVAVLHDGPVGATAREWALPAGLAPGLYAVRARGATWARARAVVVAE